MRILLLTGIQEELLPVLQPLQLTFRQHGAYQSVSYPDLYAATTGPGLKKKSDRRRPARRAAAVESYDAFAAGERDED